MLETGMSICVRLYAPLGNLELIGGHCAHSSRAHPGGCPVRCEQPKLQDGLFFTYLQRRPYQETAGQSP
jgi:hypothetical protein